VEGFLAMSEKGGKGGSLLSKGGMYWIGHSIALCFTLNISFDFFFWVFGFLRGV